MSANESVPHPMQPVGSDSHGIVRFKDNAIVRFLLDNGPNDLNKLAMLHFTQEDREQFAQLIGYSVSGYGDLSYVSPESVKKADAAYEALIVAKKPPASAAPTTYTTLPIELVAKMLEANAVHEDGRYHCFVNGTGMAMRSREALRMAIAEKLQEAAREEERANRFRVEATPDWPSRDQLMWLVNGAHVAILEAGEKSSAIMEASIDSRLEGILEAVGLGNAWQAYSGQISAFCREESTLNRLGLQAKAAILQTEALRSLMATGNRETVNMVNACVEANAGK